MKQFAANKGVIIASLLFMIGLLSACTSSTVDDGLGSANAGKPVPAQGVGNDLNKVEPVANTTTTTQPTSEQSLAEDGSRRLTPAEQAAQNSVAGTTQPTEPAAITKKITFLPVTGAPQSAVTSLAKSIRSQADERRITLLSANQPGADYQVKGYFSALDDGSGTLVVYVWDVLDPAGKRVHRISGNERSSKNSTNPWSAISETELQRVTDATMARIESWLKRQT